MLIDLLIVSFDVPETYRAQFKKLLSNYSNFYLSASIIFKSGLIYKELHCLNYIQNIINQNKNNELINVHNRIEKKFTNKEAYLCFSDTNIPLNALLIRYIFDVSYRTNEIKIDNPNFYNTIAIIEKKLNDDNINETTFVKNK